MTVLTTVGIAWLASFLVFLAAADRAPTLERVRVASGRRSLRTTT